MNLLNHFIFLTRHVPLAVAAGMCLMATVFGGQPPGLAADGSNGTPSVNTGIHRRLSIAYVGPPSTVVRPADVRRLPPVLDSANSGVRLVAHLEVVETKPSLSQAENLSLGPLHSTTQQFDPPGSGCAVFPIDLANALALGGASNLQIRLARQRVVEAQADLLEAQAHWLPSLRLGIGYNRHDGRIQDTRGEVIEAGRNSMFVGGGAGLGSAPLMGGSGGPAPFFVSISLADAYFKPLVASRMLSAQAAARRATLNDELLGIALAYFDLVEAHGMLAGARTGLSAADQMFHLTSLFAREGGGSQAEVDRAKTERAFWEQSVEEARRVAASRSAELARRVRLDPNLVLVPVEDVIAPVTVIHEGMPREALLAQGLTSRPELAQHRAIVQAALRRMRQELWRPWLPNIHVGASGGTFGGGPSSAFDNQSGRGDVDMLAIWELKNLGVANRAMRRKRTSQMQQARQMAEIVRDQIMAEIVIAAEDVASYRRQIATTRESVSAAGDSYRRNFQRVSQGEGLPIELLQAIRALAGAQDSYTKAVSNYNRAQYRLLRALGQPPIDPSDAPVEEVLMDDPLSSGEAVVYENRPVVVSANPLRR